MFGLKKDKKTWYYCDNTLISLKTIMKRYAGDKGGLWIVDNTLNEAKENCQQTGDNYIYKIYGSVVNWRGISVGRAGTIYSHAIIPARIERLYKKGKDGKFVEILVPPNLTYTYKAPKKQPKATGGLTKFIKKN
jgi:hypothetical protein